MLTKSKNLVFLAVVLFGLAAASAWWGAQGRQQAMAASGPRLDARLVDPAHQTGELVMGEPGKLVEFVYELRNTGSETLKGLRAQVF